MNILPIDVTLLNQLNRKQINSQSKNNNLENINAENTVLNTSDISGVYSTSNRRVSESEK
jgi:hypothetical protein